MATLTLELITPEGRMCRLAADAVTLPTAHRGEYGILPGHTPLVVALGRGLVRFRQGSTWHWLAVWGGVVEIQSGHVALLARHSETVQDLDPDWVQAELRHAEQLLAEARSESDLDFALASLESSLLRREVLGSPAFPVRTGIPAIGALCPHCGFLACQCEIQT